MDTPLVINNYEFEAMKQRDKSIGTRSRQQPIDEKVQYATFSAAD